MVMEFLRTVKKSVYDPGFYQEAASHPPKKALGYFARLISVISVVGIVIPAVVGLTLFMWNQQGIDTVIGQVRALYPSGLEIAFADGQVSTNVEEPYAIALPTAWQFRESRDGRTVKNLLVIDTGKPIDLDDFRRYETLVVLGKNTVGFYDTGQGKVEIRELGGINGRFVLDQGKYAWLVGEAWKWIRVALVALVIVAPLFITLFLLAWYSLYLLVGALVIWLAASLRKRDMTYGQAYKLGFYLLTLPVLAGFVARPVFTLPFVFTLILFGIAYANFGPSSPAQGEPDPKQGSDSGNTPAEPIALPAHETETGPESVPREAVLVEEGEGEAEERKEGTL